MDRAKFILLLGGGIIIFVLLLLLLSSNKAAPEAKKIAELPTPTASIPSTTFRDYTDPSGFAFHYPDNLNLITKESTDSATYADLSLTSKDIAGGIHILIKDTPLKTNTEWMEEERLSGHVIPKETKLGTIPAYALSKEDGIELIAIDTSILFSLTSNFSGKKDYWQKVHDAITASFSFALPQTPSSSTDTVSQDDTGVALESEEVIE